MSRMQTLHARERRAKSGKNHPLAMRLAKPPHKNANDFPTDPDLQTGLPKSLALAGSSLGKENEMICPDMPSSAWWQQTEFIGHHRQQRRSV